MEVDVAIQRIGVLRFQSLKPEDASQYEIVFRPKEQIARLGRPSFSGRHPTPKNSSYRAPVTDLSRYPEQSSRSAVASDLASDAVSGSRDPKRLDDVLTFDEIRFLISDSYDDLGYRHFFIVRTNHPPSNGPSRRLPSQLLQLPRNSSNARLGDTVPQPPSNHSRAVALGDSWICGITTENDLWCWSGDLECETRVKDLVVLHQPIKGDLLNSIMQNLTHPGLDHTELLGELSLG